MSEEDRKLSITYKEVYKKFSIMHQGRTGNSASSSRVVPGAHHKVQKENKEPSITVTATVTGFFVYSSGTCARTSTYSGSCRRSTATVIADIFWFRRLQEGYRSDH